MPLIKCGLCKQTQELSLFEYWTCPDCGMDYSIGIIEYSGFEIKEAFEFLERLKLASNNKCRNSALILSKDLESDEDKNGVSIVDSLLLFFDSIIIPDLKVTSLYKLFGESKTDLYRRYELIKSSDNSFVEGRVYGLATKAKYESEYDLQLADPTLEDNIDPPFVSVRSSLHNLLENLERVYDRQLLNLLKKTHLFNRNRKADKVYLHGIEYDNNLLVKLIPMRFLRNETFCFISGANFISDQYYGIANTFREYNYSRKIPKYLKDYRIFSEWLKTTQFERKELHPEDLLGFREKFQSLGPFVEQIYSELRRPRQSNRITELVREFSSEMEKRIGYYKKVMNANHEKKAMYLGGLFSTLGALIGGTTGALVGGIGGTVASQLSLEYDRRIAPQLSFIANSLLDFKEN